MAAICWISGGWELLVTLNTGPHSPTSFRKRKRRRRRGEEESHGSCRTEHLKGGHPMQINVTLRARTQVAALLRRLEQEADQASGRRVPDRRTRQTWRQLVLGVLATGSTRMLTLGRTLAPRRRARTVQGVANSLTYFFSQAHFAVRPFSTRLLEAGVRQLEPERLVTYHGKALVVLDPSEYAKRSRGTGKADRQMEYIGRVRQPKASTRTRKKRTTRPAAPRAGGAAGRVATTTGYVDVWAGLVLRGKQFLPLARHLFSSAHPHLKSQNTVEEAVLAQALGVLRRVGLQAIVLGDSGLGRKELIIRLAQQQQDCVLRLDPDITVFPTPEDPGLLLADHLAQQPWRGEVLWDRGQEGRVRCRLRTARATIRFSRSGRQHDVQEATVNFVELVPLNPDLTPLVLVTTLAITTPAQARAVARLYACRWAIETAFETMHAWGQERFMVRKWVAIDRLLWILAIAYALLLLVLHHPKLHRFCAQAEALLRLLSVVGQRLTIGKLAEAIRLDWIRHDRAWTSGWLL